MPTKTRLDPTAGGGNPPAGQDGAQGSGRGDNTKSESAPHGAAGDIAGFIDSLAALSAHITQREAFEADVRRGWTRMAALCGIILVLQGASAAWAALAPLSGGIPTAALALYAAAVGTSALAALLFSGAGATPWRAAADSIDRLALRHEDSPLRDRIRITQWMLFDSALSRFAANEQRVNAAIAHGVMLVSLMASLSLALLPVFSAAFGSATDAAARAASASLALFLILALVTIAATMRAGKQSFRAAQHYARQVLAFDADFGGFLPRAEKEHVTMVAETKVGADASGSNSE